MWANKYMGCLGLSDFKQINVILFFLYIFHRAVDIQCVIIQGIAKSAAYEVGDRNADNLFNSWNAVYIGGAWRIVFPLWACRCIAGHDTGKWTLIESNGKKKKRITNEFNALLNALIKSNTMLFCVIKNYTYF